MAVLFLPRSSGGFHFRTYYFCWPNIKLQPRVLKGNVAAMTFAADEEKCPYQSERLFLGEDFSPISSAGLRIASNAKQMGKSNERKGCISADPDSRATR